jgi:hypothetical protein
MIKRVFMVIFCMVLCLSFIYGQSLRYVKANWDSPFSEPYPGKANDFHVKGKVRSANNVKPDMSRYWSFDHVDADEGGTKWYMNGDSIRQDPEDPEYWNFELDFKTEEGYVSDGATVHFGVEYLADQYNHIEIEEAYYTKDGEWVADAMLMSFNVVERPFDGAVLTISNQLNRVAIWEQMEVAVTDINVPLQDMFYTGIGGPGTTAKNSLYSEIKWVKIPEPVKVAPKSHIEFKLADLGLSIKTGQFLLVRAIDAQTGAAQWVQHGH